MIRQFLAHHRFILIVTALIWLLIGWRLGLAALMITVILSILEITLSADNAVVNSRVLVRMSPFWQRIFLTVGIFVAVFVVRFTLPIVVVSLMTPLSTIDVFRLAIDDAARYGEYLHDVSPLIEAFGGMFLLLVSLFFFMDKKRENLWITMIERPLRSLAKLRWLKYLLALIIAGLVVMSVRHSMQLDIALALGLGAAVYLVLHSRQPR